MRLQFPSFDGKKQIRIGHGDDCVLILVEQPDHAVLEGVVLTADEAEALGKSLVIQARYATDATREASQ